MHRLESEFDKFPSPEEILGKPFRIPYILGEGTGKHRGFTFHEFHLPLGWQTAIPSLEQYGNYERYNEVFNRLLWRMNLPAGRITSDPATHIITEIVIGTEDPARLSLQTEFPNTEDGKYQASGINDARTAIAVQYGVTSFLQAIGKVVSAPEYAYIVPQERGFEPVGLILPDRKLLKAEDPVTNDYFRYGHTLDASNIAGRFGLNLKSLEYTDNGLLHYVSVIPGDRTAYYLDKMVGSYVGHNIDTPDQAAALYAITAKFLNHLYEMKESLSRQA